MNDLTELFMGKPSKKKGSKSMGLDPMAILGGTKKSNSKDSLSGLMIGNGKSMMNATSLFDGPKKKSAKSNLPNMMITSKRSVKSKNNSMGNLRHIMGMKTESKKSAQMGNIKDLVGGKYNPDNFIGDYKTKGQKRLLKKTRMGSGMSHKRFQDSDGDGVIDGLDCFRNDPTRHGVFDRIKNLSEGKGFRSDAGVARQEAMATGDQRKWAEKTREFRQADIDRAKREKDEIFERKRKLQTELEKESVGNGGSGDSQILGPLAEARDKALDDYTGKIQEEVDARREKFRLDKKVSQLSKQEIEQMNKSEELKKKDKLLSNVGGFISEKVGEFADTAKTRLGRATGYAGYTKEDRARLKAEDQGVVGKKFTRTNTAGDKLLDYKLSKDIEDRVMEARKKLNPAQIKSLDQAEIRRVKMRDKSGKETGEIKTVGTLDPVQKARETLRLARENEMNQEVEMRRRGLQREQDASQLQYARVQRAQSAANIAQFQGDAIQNRRRLMALETGNLANLSAPAMGVERRQPRMFINNIASDMDGDRDGYLDALDVQGFTPRSRKPKRWNDGQEE